MIPEYVTKDSIFDIVFGEFCACSDETEQVLNNIIEQVRALSAADVVPVVRCGECEYNGHCFTQSFVRDEGIIPFDPDTWFCADGKRTDSKA